MTNANNNFGSSNGSENFYSHKPSKVIYTDGVKELAGACGAYWLIDLIVSYQCKKQIQQQAFQVWELQRKAGQVFEVNASDGNHNTIATQQIPFSDFPYDQATLWLVDGCLMLPKEY